MPIRMICVDKSLKEGPGQLTTGGSYQIGRSSRCAFVLSDLSVSRVHAEITAREEILVVKDMESRNGTFVDEVRVEEAQLRPGQLVRFGNVRFQVMDETCDEEHSCEYSALSTHFIQGKPERQPRALPQMSEAQLPVFKLLLAGLCEKQIAAKLFRSRHTVHRHTVDIFRIMGVKSRSALMALFIADPKRSERLAE